MQYKSSGKSVSDTLHMPGIEKYVVQDVQLPVSTNEKTNTTTVTKLTIADKAGLVFVVVVLLMLQFLEKAKLLK